MLQAIVWKEFREQGLIGVILILLGSGVLVIAAMFADPAVEGATPNDVIRYLGAGRLATLMLAVTAGMVCGGAIFAAEREAGTIAFLESLPASHWQLWRAKLVAGLVLTVVQIGLLLTISTGLGLVPTFGWALAVWVYTLLAFAWGMFGSTTARTSLGSIGFALPASALTAFVVLIPIALFFHTPGSPIPRGAGGVLFLVCMFTAPLVLSSWLFCRPDRGRTATPLRHARTGFHALFWLTLRQLFIPALAMSPAALLVGLGLLVPGLQPVLAWPGLALGAGAVSGSLAFADEQIHGSSRFWAEQRLPLGRVWIVKIVTHVLFLLWLLLLLGTPMILHSQVSRLSNLTSNYGYSTLASIFGSPLFDELGLANGFKYLILPAVYGFAAGQLCGLIFRKLVVSCGVAGVVGGMGTIVWGPSLLAGGVEHWQLWLPPILLLLSGRVLISAWAADRLSTRGPFGTLLTGTLAAILALAAGIGYRVMEVPNSPNGEDDVRYMAKLPSIEANSSGSDFKRAAELYSQTIAKLSPEFDRATSTPSGSQFSPRMRITDQALIAMRNAKLPEVVLGKLQSLKDKDMYRPDLQREIDKLLDEEETKEFRDTILSHLPNGAGRRLRAEERLERVPYQGWPSNDSNLEVCLDQVFSGGNELAWHALVASATERPLGIFEHPLMIGTAGVAKNVLEYARQMSVALLARGLQLQARGDSAAFVPLLRQALTLARSMRNGSAIACMEMGYAIERVAVLAMDRWIEHLPQQTLWLRAAIAPLPPPLATAIVAQYEAATATSQTQLLKLAIALLESCDSTEAFDATNQFLVERHIIRESLKAPVQWLPQLLALPPETMGITDPVVDLISLAWAVPWEKERTRRLVGLGYESNPPGENSMLLGRPGASLMIRSRSHNDLAEIDRQISTYRRAGILKLAIRAFRIERGNYPKNISELVTTGYLLRDLPDPYDETHGFGYRISEGEKLTALPRSPGERIMISQEPSEYWVPTGQVIIWSVGYDRKDQNGRNPPGPILTITNRADDIVFLVPFGPTR